MAEAAGDGWADGAAAGVTDVLSVLPVPQAIDSIAKKSKRAVR